MEFERVRLSDILLFVAVLVAFLAFDQSVGWRVVGVAQLVFTVRILREKEVGVGWEGFRPSFYLRGTAAVLVVLLSLVMAVMLVVFPEHTVMKLFR